MNDLAHIAKLEQQTHLTSPWQYHPPKIWWYPSAGDLHSHVKVTNENGSAFKKNLSLFRTFKWSHCIHKESLRIENNEKGALDFHQEFEIAMWEILLRDTPWETHKVQCNLGGPWIPLVKLWLGVQLWSTAESCPQTSFWSAKDRKLWGARKLQSSDTLRRRQESSNKPVKIWAHQKASLPSHHLS